MFQLRAFMVSDRLQKHFLFIVKIALNCFLI